MDLLYILGISSNFFTILFFISPAVMIINLLKTKDTSKIPYLLFLFTNINCLFWFIYGVGLKSWPIYSNNFFGVVANVLYLTLFIVYVDNLSASSKTLIIALYLAFNITTFSFFYMYVKDQEISGSIAMVFNVIMNLSQLQKLREVFIYKDNSYIPLFTVTCLFLQSTLWTTIGILSNYNMFIIVPNFLGLSLALMQIIIWFFYMKTENKIEFKYDYEKEERKAFN